MEMLDAADPVLVATSGFHRGDYTDTKTNDGNIRRMPIKGDIVQNFDDSEQEEGSEIVQRIRPPTYAPPTGLIENPDEAEDFRAQALKRWDSWAPAKRAQNGGSFKEYLRIISEPPPTRTEHPRKKRNSDDPFFEAGVATAVGLRDIRF
jgi:hypothetical protein